MKLEQLPDEALMTVEPITESGPHRNMAIHKTSALQTNL